MNSAGIVPLVKLNEGRVLGSKVIVEVEVGELKLNPPVNVDVDDCKIATSQLIIQFYLKKTYERCIKIILINI